jgi:hypothetical protein
MKTYDHTDALRSPMIEWHPKRHVFVNRSGLLGWSQTAPGAVIHTHNPYSTDYPCGETHY